jgi:prevent-host-death family protein
MPGNTYSTYEAKARFSEILRKVLKNRPVVITSRGRPVARIIAYETESESLEQRLLRLEKQGIVSGDPSVSDWFDVMKRREGVVKQFLMERGCP